MSWRQTVAGLSMGLLLVASACGGGNGDSQPKQTLAPEAERGRSLVEDRGCFSCHATDRRRSAGPTWQGLAGSRVRLADGREVTADADYLRRSILEPDAEIVKGFPGGLMASVIRPGTVSAEEADAIVKYLETLR